VNANDIYRFNARGEVVLEREEEEAEEELDGQQRAGRQMMAQEFRGQGFGNPGEF